MPRPEPDAATASLLADASRRADSYVATLETRRLSPGADALAGLETFDEQLPDVGHPAGETIAMLDEAGSPGTVASGAPAYFGYVIGGSLPVTMAAERLAGAWDQCAAGAVTSPVAHRIEQVTGRWLLDMLDLPRESGVAFGTSATSCGLACLAAARRELLRRAGWDFDADGVAGAPEIRVVVSDTIHVTVMKVLRVLGFGRDRVIRAPVDAHGRVDPDLLPDLDERTILCLQAGEVNTGESDPFATIIPRARAAGAWVHVDGAFGLWARASDTRAYLADGVEAADSWTVDGHKWLNTPYDGAVGICRDPEALVGAMHCTADYAAASAQSQQNLGLEFSRRARGIPIWAALRTLGRQGVAEMIDRHCLLALRLAQGLKAEGMTVLNRVCLNQVLVALESDEATERLLRAAVGTGRIWFGPTRWNGRTALRFSVSSWRTDETHIDEATALLARAIALAAREEDEARRPAESRSGEENRPPSPIPAEAGQAPIERNPDE